AKGTPGPRRVGLGARRAASAGAQPQGGCRSGICRRRVSARRHGRAAGGRTRHPVHPRSGACSPERTGPRSLGRRSGGGDSLRTLSAHGAPTRISGRKHAAWIVGVKQDEQVLVLRKILTVDVARGKPLSLEAL